MSREPVRVLGVDTSLRSTGIAVVEARGNTLKAIQYGTIKNPPKRLHSECLANLYAGIQEVIEAEKPQVAAVEGVFFAKNVRTSVILGQARGAVLAACAVAGLPVYEYPPRRVKQALVGTGSAQKQQVARMVMTILGLSHEPQEDAADALAIAICHLHSQTPHAPIAPKQI